VKLLYFFTFFAIPFGCLTNCLPCALPFLLACVVAAYSLAVKPFIAFSGKYLSPVTDDFLPDLVCHFCLLQALRDL